MKNAIISAVLMMFLCVFIFPCFVSAEETEGVEPPASEVETIPEETTPPAEDVTPPADEEPTPTTTPEGSEPASFTAVDWFYDNLDKIFTGSGLAASIVIAYLFRKKLLPNVAAVIGQISTAVVDIKKGAAESSLMQNEDVRAFFEKNQPILDEVHKNADACKKALELVEQSKGEREAMTVAMQEMSSVLLAMIESSRLPESVKEKARLSEINTKKLVDSLRTPPSAEIPSESAIQP